jgi:hypothetical protein
MRLNESVNLHPMPLVEVCMHRRPETAAHLLVNAGKAVLVFQVDGDVGLVFGVFRPEDCKGNCRFVGVEGHVVCHAPSMQHAIQGINPLVPGRSEKATSRHRY